MAHSTNSDSIMMGAGKAAAGSVMPSLNSSSLLTLGLGFWVQKAAKSVEENRTLYTSWLYSIKKVNNSF